MSAPRRFPGPWHGIRSERMRAGSLRDAGLMRRSPGTGPPTLRHGPPDLAPDFRSGEERRRRNR